MVLNKSGFIRQEKVRMKTAIIVLVRECQELLSEVREIFYRLQSKLAIFLIW